MPMTLQTTPETEMQAIPSQALVNQRQPGHATGTSV
jgi:hypothetical protein